MIAERRFPGSPLILFASAIGVLAFLYPFVLPLVGAPEQVARRGIEIPLLFALLALTCLLVILFDAQSRTTGYGPSASKMVALLAVLVAVDAALRLVPSLLGASPIFLLIMLAGYAYGPDFGFLMGALTLLVSAFLTGGIGPWLVFQMLTAGWVGMTAGWLPRPGGWREIALLCGFGAVWGFGYGAVMNLWSWPFAAPGLEQPAGLYWVPGMTAIETLSAYARFYLVTSLGYDLFRAAGNVALVLLLARPLLRLLDRYRARFSWQPWEAVDPPDEAASSPDGQSSPQIT
jgi:energy-coupling factor transport system substrate-specific component